MRDVDALDQVSRWPVETAAVGVLARDSAGTVWELGQTGPQGHPFPLASVSKMLVAYAVLIAVEEGALALDSPAGPPSSTVAHLLAHASGLPFEGAAALGATGSRRIYSNVGFDLLGAEVTRASGIAFADYLTEAVFTPLGMTGARLVGPPSSGVTATLADLRRFAAELLAPRLLSAQTFATATSVAFPGLSGVLPGFGRQTPNDWGLGFEIRGDKRPHWTGSTNSARTFGHFGQAGTFLWVDPTAQVGCITLCDRKFGDWARECWPPLSDDVLAQARPTVVNPSV